MADRDATIVRTRQALLDAVAVGAGRIVVASPLADLPTIRLVRGQVIEGGSPDAALVFDRGADGLGLTASNSIRNLAVRTDADRRAIFVAREEGDMGLIALRGLRCHGQVQLLFERAARIGHLLVEDVWIENADTTARRQRPQGNGVRVLQGALTIWNRVSDDVALTVGLSAIRIGSAAYPVRGGGLLVAGSGRAGGGRVLAPMIETLGIHIDSRLLPGTEDMVCGGLFVLHGTKVDRIRSAGAIVSHGPNAVPVDNWGAVHDWRVDCDIVSHGPNAVAIVNAGRLDLLDIRGGVETFGDGARGCAVYGPIEHLRARSIRTHASAATAVQIDARLGLLEVPGEIETKGQGGIALVKGVMEDVRADGIHISKNGILACVRIGAIVTSGKGTLPMRCDGIGPVG